VIFRGVAFLSLLFVQLFAFDYSKCAEKLRDSFVYIDGVTTLAIEKNRTIYISRDKTHFKSAKVIKHDPFFGIYLLDYPHDKQPINLRQNHIDEMALVYKEGFSVGSIKSLPYGFRWGELDFSVKDFGVLGDICYRSYAIANKGGFLDAEHIKRFLNSKQIVYASIGGVELLEGQGGVRVGFSNPFYPHNQLLDGDLIVSIDGVAIRNLDDYYASIMYKQVGVDVRVEIVRGGERVVKNIKTIKLVNGGLVHDLSVLDIGIEIDKNMRVVSVKNQNYGFAQLKKGDEIISINRQNIDSIPSLKGVLSKITTNDIKMLIERDNFMFFISLEGQRSY